MAKNDLTLWNGDLRIKPVTYTAYELAQGFIDNGESGGAWCLNNILCLRPSFQRNEVWDEEKKKNLITTIANNAPIGAIYLGRELYDNNVIAYQIVTIDGQQRLISICKFINGEYSITYNGENLFFDDLFYELPEVYNIIKNYQPQIYECIGTLNAQLRWFDNINANAVVLTEQERRNAIFMGEGTEILKHYFSIHNCAGYTLAKNLTSTAASWNRQGLLECALKWVSQDDIAGLMAKVHNDPEAAQEVCNEFNNIIDWVNNTFINQEEDRIAIMKHVDWGWLYYTFGDEEIDPDAIEKEITALLRGDEDHEEVEKSKGIYTYIFTHNPRELTFRVFNDAIKHRIFEKQNRICNICHKPITWKNAHADHIKPWSLGGRTVESNCQILCAACNLKKSNKYEGD